MPTYYIPTGVYTTLNQNEVYCLPNCSQFRSI